eukprot:15468170-Alexandrium_andersonii.AAC.1
MADAGDENSMLVRFCDAGDSCPAEELAPQCESFLHRLHVLFVEGRCLRTSYTKYMLEVLEQGITTFVWGQPRSIGGTSQG